MAPSPAKVPKRGTNVGAQPRSASMSAPLMRATPSGVKTKKRQNGTASASAGATSVRSTNGNHGRMDEDDIPIAQWARESIPNGDGVHGLKQRTKAAANQRMNDCFNLEESSLLSLIKAHKYNTPKWPQVTEQCDTKTAVLKQIRWFIKFHLNQAGNSALPIEIRRTAQFRVQDFLGAIDSLQAAKAARKKRSRPEESNGDDDGHGPGYGRQSTGRNASSTFTGAAGGGDGDGDGGGVSRKKKRCEMQVTDVSQWKSAPPATTAGDASVGSTTQESAQGTAHTGDLGALVTMINQLSAQDRERVQGFLFQHNSRNGRTAVEASTDNRISGANGAVVSVPGQQESQSSAANDIVTNSSSPPTTDADAEVMALSTPLTTGEARAVTDEPVPRGVADDKDRREGQEPVNESSGAISPMKARLDLRTIIGREGTSYGDRPLSALSGGDGMAVDDLEPLEFRSGLGTSRNTQHGRVEYDARASVPVDRAQGGVPAVRRSYSEGQSHYNVHDDSHREHANHRHIYANYAHQNGWPGYDPAIQYPPMYATAAPTPPIGMTSSWQYYHGQQHPSRNGSERPQTGRRHSDAMSTGYASRDYEKQAQRSPSLPSSRNGNLMNGSNSSRHKSPATFATRSHYVVAPPRQTTHKNSGRDTSSQADSSEAPPNSGQRPLNGHPAVSSSAPGNNGEASKTDITAATVEGGRLHALVGARQDVVMHKMKMLDDALTPGSNFSCAMNMPRPQLFVTYKSRPLTDETARDCVYRLGRYDPYWQLLAVLGIGQTEQVAPSTQPNALKTACALRVDLRECASDSVAMRPDVVTKMLTSRITRWGLDEVQFPESGECRLLCRSIPFKHDDTGKVKRADGHFWPKGTFLQLEHAGSRAALSLRQRNQQSHADKPWTGTCAPLNLTPRLGQNSQFQVQLCTYDPDRYFFCLSFNQYRPPAAIYDDIMQGDFGGFSKLPREKACTKALEHTQAAHVLDESDCEDADTAEFAKFVFSLRCPVTKRPIETPVRGRHCRHFQCFDLMAYLESYNTTTGIRWRCFSCENFVTLDELEYCGLTQELLDEFREELETTEKHRVQFHSDASYQLLPEDRPRHGNRGGVAGDRSTAGDSVPSEDRKPAPADSAAVAAPGPSENVIELMDSDDE